MEGDELMKLKTIRNNLERIRNRDNDQVRQEMFSLLQQRYNEEIAKDPNGVMCIKVIDIMKQYGCPMTAEQSKLDKSVSITKKRKNHSTNAHELGSSFTNPYSFIPFSSKKPTRKEPTPRTIDEEEDRYSGILQIKVKLNSPLLSPEAEPVNPEKQNPHKSYRALKIGDSVIYPATGVRGAMRHLMTVVTGGSLRYLDNESYLCDDRWDSNKKNEKNLQLGLITKVGDRNKPGTIALGTQRFIRVKELEALFSQKHKRLDDYRDGRVICVKWDSNMKKPEFSFEKNPPIGFDKRLKVSGRPVGRYDKKMQKKEWVFTPDYDREITVPQELWVEYQSRYLHGPIGPLKVGHLVWVEPIDEGRDHIINHGGEAQSIQWAKWGKEGDRLADKIPEGIKPDYSINSSKKVDEVSNLFGQVCPDKKYVEKAPSFSGRIRPDNVVFANAISELKEVTLSPLQPPHPGCKAFYRDKSLTNMKGYKVYRTTNEKNDDAPYHYHQQPVFDNGRPKNKHQKVNKTVELLSTNVTGHLNISFTALSKREYSLLRLICSLPQRFGGGKPFGLGRTSLEVVAVKNEFGKTISEPVPEWIGNVVDLRERVELYKASQQPVDKMRYPRATTENNNKINTGGYVWFGINADLSNSKYNLRSKPIKRNSNLHEQINASKLDPQPLPELTLEPDGDLLFGYDLMFKEQMNNQRQQELTDATPFDPARDIRSHHSPGRNTSPNRETRQKQRQDR